ncbi:hypothetical protein TUN199_09978 [Pyrenophora tritici-repentis]|nr:hypothetical protein PtrV1_06106 [Pyrenophora tritici-repentis]KAF7450834.1 hypothetical protein A1F99_054500 [Pyrenophora tritici-repentis]KAI0573067.1 hypothetical protein Alg215_09399 [Pyrenophora tritici-repentis]KAI0604050.1 hypothetical protein TUN205_11704 [Pyrenophora tritici-repentis]KAI0618022.1 hypothetical protein TUN199_09978 [Pyrenophora tritici-repentis]
MDVRGVRYSAGENLLQTTINDIYSHREDAEYATRFIGANPETKKHYVVRCETLSDISKERNTMIRYIGEVLLCAYGAVPQIDTP